ncbi:MAG: hypothetical protein ACK5QT_09215 [Oligoflexia bacterium]
MADKKNPEQPEVQENASNMSSRAKARIAREMKQAEAERKRDSIRKRLGVARTGVDSLIRESYGEATKSFMTYLRLLEAAKRVGPGKLHPSQFDQSKELPELVLVTGIYWDLARTFDRMKSKKRNREHIHYLEQFVVFSKSARCERLCAETLRKYLVADKALHRGDFKNAYKALGGTTCFIVSSLLDLVDLESLPQLSRFRDQFLLRTAVGRWIVHQYEYRAPSLARWLDSSPRWVRRAAAGGVDAIAWMTRMVI